MWYTLINYNKMDVPASPSLQARAGAPVQLMALTQININEMLRCLDLLNFKTHFRHSSFCAQH